MTTGANKTRGAVIVTRVSTGDQDRNGTSPETQREMCRAKAAALGVPIIAEYYDGGVSGAFLLSRAGMQRAIADIRAGRADTLICPTISRYSRDRAHQEAIKKAVHQAGGQLVFCDMEYTDTAAGNLQFNITGDFAVYERDLFRERSMLGKRNRAENGLQPCRSWVPYGYHVPTKNDVMRGDFPLDQIGKYLLVHSEVPTVERIFAAYTLGTHSLHRLARELNVEGIPTAQGGAKWHPTSIKHILTNPIYMGKAAFGRRRCRADEDRLQQTHWRTGLPLTTARYQVDLPEEQWTFLPAPAIVSQETWDAAQERLSINRSRFGGNPKTAHLLSGRVVCPQCGGSMFRWTAPNRPPAFACLTHRKKKQMEGAVVCVPTRYLASVMEEATVTAVSEGCECPEAVAEALAVYTAPLAATSGDGRQEMAALDKALSQVRAEETAAVQAQIAGIMAGASPDAYAEAFAQIAARRKDLEDRRGTLARSLRVQGGPKRPAPAGEVLAEALRDVRRVLLSPDVPGHEKRDALGLIVEKVICREGGADVLFRPGVFSSDTVQSVSIRLMPS